MKVTEIFESFQGEGIYSGMPAIFLRLGQCNLNCEWCDTSYARKEFKEMDVEKISKKINSSKLKTLIITGGEPLLQEKALSSLVKKINKKIHIETNGTLFPAQLLKKIDFISVSPKLSSSKNKNAINITILKRYLKNYADKLQLKFIISDKKEIQELQVLLKKLKAGSKIPVIIQANNKNMHLAGYSLKSRKLFNTVLKTKLCENYDIRLMMQLHKIVFGHQRKK